MITNYNDFLLLEKKRSKYKTARTLLASSRKFSKEMKEKIKKYISSGTSYSNGRFHGLRKPKIEGLCFSRVGFGADKNGFYVYTHRARSKSHPTPDEITEKEITFIESTG